MDGTDLHCLRALKRHLFELAVFVELATRRRTALKIHDSRRGQAKPRTLVASVIYDPYDIRLQFSRSSRKRERGEIIVKSPLTRSLLRTSSRLGRAANLMQILPSFPEFNVKLNRAEIRSRNERRKISFDSRRKWLRLASQRLSKRLVSTTSIIRDDEDGNAIDGSAIQPRFPLLSSRVIGASRLGETQESTRRGVRRVEKGNRASRVDEKRILRVRPFTASAQ